METINMHNRKQQVANFLQKSGKVLTIVALAAVAIVGSYYYGKYKNTQDPAKPKMQIQPSIKLKDVSIAVNERNEVLIIDRTTGEYMTYQDSVGLAIFNMYAGRLYTANTEK
jgi:hypothetical protein